MEDYFVRAVKTMNYLFLRTVIGKMELDSVLKNEMTLFYEGVANSKTVNKQLFDIIKTEMDEGGYLDDLTLNDFADKVAETIGVLMGEVNEDVYNLYTYIAGSIVEEK